MKGYNSDYGGGGNAPFPQNGSDYNPAGSKSVKEVDSVSTYVNAKKMPEKGEPNSVSRNYKNGHLFVERYFDKKGNPYLDIDYTNHGNPKTHPKVPHEHDIWIDSQGGFHRKGDKGIQK